MTGARGAAPLEPARAFRASREWLLPAAIFSGAILLLFAPAVLSDAQFLYRDSGRLHAPVKRWIAEELSAGRFPSWNPFEGMGTSLVTDPVHAVQHPFNLLLLALPFPAAFKGWVLASYLAAAAGAFAWARRLGADREGGMVAGLAYSLSGFLVSSSDNVTYLTTAAFAPWVLAAGHAWVSSGRFARLAALMVASWLCAASGDPMAWAIAIAIVPVQALLQDGVPRRVALLRGLAGGLGAALASAPILLPLARGLADSARAGSVDDAARALWNLHPLRLAEFAVPGLSSDPTLDTANEVLRVFTGAPASYGPWVLSLYAGVTVLALGAAAARLRAVRPLLGAAALFLWAAMGPHAGFGQLARRLPVLSSLRYWEKLAVWPTLLLAAAAGLGASALFAGRVPARRVLGIAVGAASAAAALLAVARLAPLERWLRVTGDAGAAAAALAVNVGEGSLHVLALAGALGAGVALLLRSGQTRRLPAFVVLLVALDLVAANVRGYRLATPTDRVPRSELRARLAAEAGLAGLVTPFHLAPTPDDGLSPFESKWLRGAQTLLPAWNTADHVRNATPYSALYPLRLARYEEAVPLETRVATLGLFGFGFVAVPGLPALLEGTALHPAWSVAASDPAFGALVSIPHRSRAYLAAAARAASAGEALAFAGDPASVESPLTLLEGPPPGPLSGGQATIELADATKVRIRTSSDGPALLVLNDTFAAGWSARVDGRPAALLAANYLARGVAVGAGVHAVEFRYRPPLLREGWAVALGAMALVLGAAWRDRRRAVGDPTT
jgi:hypothetical protein